MNSDEDDDILKPEKLPIYQKGKEIFDMVNKIAALIHENDEYLNDIKACMLSDAVSAHSIKTPTKTYPFAVLTLETSFSPSFCISITEDK